MFSSLPWKYLPQTRHAYTLLLERDTEQSFSKSKSRTDRSMVSKKGQLLLIGCSAEIEKGKETRRVGGRKRRDRNRRARDAFGNVRSMIRRCALFETLTFLIPLYAHPLPRHEILFFAIPFLLLLILVFSVFIVHEWPRGQDNVRHSTCRRGYNDTRGSNRVPRWGIRHTV